MRRRVVIAAEWVGLVMVAPVGATILLTDLPKWFYLANLVAAAGFLIAAQHRRKLLDDQADELATLRQVAAMDISLYLREVITAESGPGAPFRNVRIRESLIVQLSAEQAYLSHKYGGYYDGPHFETMRLGDNAVSLVFTHRAGISMPVSPVQIRNLA